METDAPFLPGESAPARIHRRLAASSGSQDVYTGQLGEFFLAYARGSMVAARGPASGLAETARANGYSAVEALFYYALPVAWLDDVDGLRAIVDELGGARRGDIVTAVGEVYGGAILGGPPRSAAAA